MDSSWNSRAPTRRMDVRRHLKWSSGSTQPVSVSVLVSGDPVIFNLAWKISERLAIAAAMASSSSRAGSERSRRVSRNSGVATVDFSDESGSSGPEEDSLSSEFSTDSDKALNQPRTYSSAWRWIFFFLIYRVFERLRGDRACCHGYYLYPQGLYVLWARLDASRCTARAVLSKTETGGRSQHDAKSANFFFCCANNFLRVLLKLLG